MGCVLEFAKVFVDLISAIAWPAAIVSVIYYFKKEFADLINSIQSIRVGDYEAVIINRMSVAERESKKLKVGDPVENTASQDEYLPYMVLAEKQPKAAISKAHDHLIAKVDGYLTAVWSKKHPDSPNSISSMINHRELTPQGVKELALRDAGWLSHAEFTMLRNLEGTKNLALNSSSQDINYIISSEFINLCQKLDASITAKLNDALREGEQRTADPDTTPTA